MNILREVDGLVFEVSKSLRYHKRRQGHFATMHLRIVACSAVFGTSGVAALVQSSPWISVPVLALTAVGAAIYMVKEPATQAKVHADLHKEFSALGADIAKTPRPTIRDLANWKARRIQIEADEPPTYWALETDCYVEECRALGRPVLWNCRITWVQRLLMHYIRFDRVSVPAQQVMP
jgi:hypothetical protein